MVAGTLVNATDIAAWAARRVAETTLPRLVRRLLRASGANLQRLSFAADEGVQLGGWDGITVATPGSESAPWGQAGWELSTRSGVKGKADEDYTKRSSEVDPVLVPAETTYVALTARRWSNKEKWAKQRTSEGIWKEVRAYDADDLEAWLEAAPAVHVWFSLVVGKHTFGLQDFSHTWDEWSGSTSPALSPRLVAGGRTKSVEAVHAWLRTPAKPFALQADSPEEALAFFLACVQLLPDEERLAIETGGLVVTDLQAWDSVVLSSEPLLLVPTFGNHSVLARAVQRGHRVFIPLGREDSKFGNVHTLPRLSRDEAERAFEELGVQRDTARDLATLARRSLMSLRRKLSIVPAVQRPRWATATEARGLLPALLAGTWDALSPGDQEVLGELAGRSYDEYEQEIAAKLGESDPPLRKIGNTWLLVSKEDAWRLLSQYLTPRDFERFAECVEEAFGVYDPAFEVEPEKRYMARVIGQPPRYSGHLLKGLADTLALLGALGGGHRLGEASTAQDHAQIIVSRLLQRANSDWRIWASLDSILPRLAEAAPDAFLNAVENGLRGDNPVLMNLFREEGEGLFGSRSYQCGLLWAMETLAWNPEVLSRTTLLLGRMARLDPGGEFSTRRSNHANRPENSLREIFLVLHPHTSASAQQRQAVLRTLSEREPEVGWSLLCRIIPGHHNFSHPTSKPEWRDWVPEARERPTWPEIWKAVAGIAERLLELVGTKGKRWASLIDRVEHLPKDSHNAVLQRLLTADVTAFQADDRIAVWTALREQVQKHREFTDAEWALPEALVKPLERAMKRFQPEDSIEKYQWLFGDGLRVVGRHTGDWQENSRRIRVAQKRGLTLIYRAFGLAGIYRLIGRVASPRDVGGSLAGAGVLTVSDEQTLLGSCLASEEPSSAHFIHGYVFTRAAEAGEVWSRTSMDQSTWSNDQRAAFLAAHYPSKSVWDRVDAEGDEVQQQYWQSIGPYYVGDNLDDALRVVTAFLKHQRPFTAINAISSYTHDKSDFPAPLVAEALEMGVRTEHPERPAGSMLSYYVANLLRYIETSGEIAEERIAQLEWSYLRLLDRHGEREPRVLHRELARNPAFFAEVVCLVYKAEEERGREPSEAEATRAQLAYQLLDGWNSIPGRLPDGAIDAGVLRQWVLEAREAIRASGRAIADHVIGEVLRYAPTDADGAWPAVPVRDLIEELASEDLERSIEREVYNSRGVTTRSPTAGGGQERELVAQYTDYARIVAARWPRTAAMLRSIADTYERDARREDTSAELTEDLW